MKCIGNCATCEVAPESKAACCAVQTLKNIIEAKAVLVDIRQMLVEQSKSTDPFAGVPTLEEITEPTDLGAEDNKEVLNN